ncbi:hypothetical protein Q1695_012844 [Nippostrongylus brasiliensis]|nr:hypothetical protein Q1695_012844 [Nippostrongylus brasiliensis]
MDMWPASRLMNRMMYDTMRDIDHLERSLAPYWRHADHSVLHVANDVHKIVDNNEKFAVSMDVSQFHPEELKVHLDGRQLTVEGVQEHKTQNSSMHRSFKRQWTLPENVNLEAVQTQLDDKGHLSIEAPKGDVSMKRNIPIMPAPK